MRPRRPRGSALHRMNAAVRSCCWRTDSVPASLEVPDGHVFEVHEMTIRNNTGADGVLIVVRAATSSRTVLDRVEEALVGWRPSRLLQIPAVKNGGFIWAAQPGVSLVCSGKTRLLLYDETSARRWATGPGDGHPATAWRVVVKYTDRTAGEHPQSCAARCAEP